MKSRAHDLANFVDLGVYLRRRAMARVQRLHLGATTRRSSAKADAVAAIQRGPRIRRRHHLGWKPGGCLPILAPRKLYLYPTGVGEQRVIDLGDLSAGFGTWENDLTFSRDGRWALVSAFDRKNQIRDYLFDMRDGKLRPVTPVGSRAGKLSPDATQIVTLDVAGAKYVLVDVASGKVSDIAGLERTTRCWRWRSDGGMVNVWNQDLPARISQVDVATGSGSWFRPSSRWRCWAPCTHVWSPRPTARPLHTDTGEDYTRSTSRTGCSGVSVLGDCRYSRSDKGSG